MKPQGKLKCKLVNCADKKLFNKLEREGWKAPNSPCMGKVAMFREIPESQSQDQTKSSRKEKLR